MVEEDVGLVTDLEPVGLYLTVADNSGSPQHYYHYLLRYLVPMLLAWSKIQEKAAGRPIYARSCQVLDTITRSVDLPGLQLVAQQTHRKIAKRLREGKKVEDQLEFEKLAFYDRPDWYDLDDFNRVRAIVFDKLQETIAVEQAKYVAKFEAGKPRILVLNRGAASDFYSSKKAEHRTSGVERRSIPNIAEVVSIAKSYGSVITETLESCDNLSTQVALFSTADVVIGQHGAGLVNLLWARPGTSVIEFVPRMAEQKHFVKLSQLLGLNHHRIRQRGNHAAVNLDAYAKQLEVYLS